MFKKLKKIYTDSPLASKIRYSYLLLIIPFLLFLIFCFFSLWNMNSRYEDMINSTVVASEFSLDFKKDFDYETYLLIVGNKDVGESSLGTMIADAKRIVSGLEELTDSPDNLSRLSSVGRYLNNLETYVRRIDENLTKGNLYEKNIEIWENDIQIVTSLVRETIFQYTYYEIRGLQETRQQSQTLFMRLITVSAIMFAVILAAVLFLSYYIPQSITRPFRRLKDVTEEVAKGNLSVRSDVHDGVEVSTFSDSLNTMIDKINELFEQITGEQKRLRKAEFELLQSQINPHFLYNTLDAIVWLAEAGDQKKVVSMVGSLSEFFRKSLNQGRDIVSIREELSHVRSYLEIQQVRYMDILAYEIDVPESLFEYKIPKISIQPLVENALYHGIKNKRGGGSIRISGFITASEDTGCPKYDLSAGSVTGAENDLPAGSDTGAENDLPAGSGAGAEKGFPVSPCSDPGVYIVVTDTGIGMEKQELEKVRKAVGGSNKDRLTNYGLYNVNERIRLNFGEACGITIDSIHGRGTRVTIKLPLQQ